jgi:hypothetical protein
MFAPPFVQMSLPPLEQLGQNGGKKDSQSPNTRKSVSSISEHRCLKSFIPPHFLYSHT